MKKRKEFHLHNSDSFSQENRCKFLGLFVSIVGVVVNLVDFYVQVAYMIWAINQSLGPYGGTNDKVTDLLEHIVLSVKPSYCYRGNSRQEPWLIPLLYLCLLLQE